MKKTITAIGLMSGTSSDGIDASIIKSDGEDTLDLIGNLFFPYGEKTRIEISKLKEKINKVSDLEANRKEIIYLEEKITFLHICLLFMSCLVKAFFLKSCSKNLPKNWSKGH